MCVYKRMLWRLGIEHNWGVQVPLGFQHYFSPGNLDTSYTSVSVLLMPVLHQKVQAL